MASKMNKKFSADVRGVLSIEDGQMSVEVEDVDGTVVLSDFFKDFADKEVKITIAYGEEL